MKRSTFTSCFIAMFLVFLGVNEANAQANCSPTCNDLVQTSFDVWCKVPLTYDMFLEDGDNPRTCTPNGPQAFVVQAMDHTGKLIASSDDPDDDYLTCEDLTANLYEPFMIKVKHWATGNSCWGTLVLEDKLDPTLEIQDVELWCNEPFDADYIEWTKGAGVGYPRGFDNCDELRILVNGSLRVDENRHGRDCNDLELKQVGDEITDIDCHPDGDVSAKIVRTWMLCDKFGNCVMGEQVITMRRLTIGQLNLPPDYDDWDRPALRPNKANDCQVNTMPGLVYDGESHMGFPGRHGDGGTTQEPTGAPMKHGIPVSKIGDKDGYSYPWDDFGFCEINVTWEDQRIDVCVGSYKILRNWTIVDWCTGEIVRHTQIIKILDEETKIDAGDDLTLSTNNNPYACEADFVPTPAEIWEACGEVRTVTMTIEGYRQKTHPHPVWAVERYTLVDNLEGVVSGSKTGDPVIVNFAPQKLGGPICAENLSVPAKYIVTYKTIDHCGNTDEDSYEVVVEDKTAPTPVCDEITQTTVGTDCKSTIFAATFDDGSYDNCGPITLSVRRMDSSDPSYHPYVEFGPADVWKSVEGGTCMVALRATDCAGNAQDCMVEVIVDDKIGSVTTVQDRTIKCSDLDNNGVIPADVIASLATSNDNCGSADHEIIDIRDWRNDCHVGFVEYDYKSYDIHGVPSGVVTATVTVVDDTPVEVVFPEDYTAYCTAETGGFTDALDPDVTGRPVITGDDCELVGVSYEDEYVFTISDNACFKIIRTWNVIDWCAFDEEHPSEPQTFKHTQIIKVKDEVAPVITVEADRIVCIDATDDCSTVVEVEAPVVTDCSSDVRVRAEWAYTADAWYCGSDQVGEVADASQGFTSPSFEPGTLVVTIIADDGCNNVSKETITYKINDCKLPTPVCRDIYTAIMPSTGLVTLWATDLDIKSYDNCDGCASTDLQFSFSPDVEDTNITLTCTDADSKTVDLYVTDHAGNQDFCTTTINVQVNPGACGGSVQSPFTQSAISGTISNEAGEMVDQVTVQAADKAVTTGVNGAYNFHLEQGADYTVSAEKNMDPLNGVSTFDLVLLRKHIVGTQELTSPYQLIAADINKSGNISAFDMVELRKVVLQLVPNFPSNTSWRFVDKNYQFSSTNPLGENFSEAYDISNLSSDMAVNFIAVKVGDLNGNAIPNSLVGSETRNVAGTFAFNMEDRFVQAGEKVSVEFTSADMATTQGFQFSLNFNGLELDQVVEGLATTANFNTTAAKRGVISTSWDGLATEKEVAFGLTFTATTSGQLSEMLNVSSDQVTAEAYSTEGALLDVAINFSSENAASFELFQNSPNPFDGATLIGFNLPQAGSATLKVLDVQGKVLRAISADYAKGFNQISLDAKELNATGVLYYQLESAEQVATRKMIVID